MKKLFGSSANAGGVVGRVTQQTMQYAGKATKTVDEDFERLTMRFKELLLRAEAAEKVLRLHYDAVVGIMEAMQVVADASDNLFAPESKDGHSIFATAVGAVNGHECDSPPARTDCVRAKFAESYAQRVWGPLKSYRLDMSMIERKQAQRNSMRLDYDAAFRTASQYAKKPPKDIVKKQKADALVEQTGVMYNMVNQEVMSKMSYYMDGRVKFWGIIMHAVMELEAMSGLGTNNLAVPAIKQLTAWVASTPAPSTATPPCADSQGQTPTECGVQSTPGSVGAGPIGFGASPPPSNFEVPLDAPIQDTPTGMFAGLDTESAGFGDMNAVQPRIPPTTPAEATEREDPWDAMFNSGTVGGSAI